MNIYKEIKEKINKVITITNNNLFFILGTSFSLYL